MEMKSIAIVLVMLIISCCALLMLWSAMIMSAYEEGVRNPDNFARVLEELKTFLHSFRRS